MAHLVVDRTAPRNPTTPRDSYVTPTGGRDPLQHPFGPGGWKVIVSPVDSAEVIAQTQFANRRTANRIRDEFVRAVRVGGIDRTDVGRIKRMLKA